MEALKEKTLLNAEKKNAEFFQWTRSPDDLLFFKKPEHLTFFFVSCTSCSSKCNP